MADASSEVADAIRSWMFGRELKPGDRLGREEDLARRFNVSRPTLREALRLLSSAHLVRATKGPGGGIFVAATAEEGIGRTVAESVAGMLSANTIAISELLETRMLLEVPLAGLAAVRATGEDIAVLRSLTDAAAWEPERVLDADVRFHRHIAHVAGNRLGDAFVEWVGAVLLPELHRIVEPALVTSVVALQHAEIVRAIERADAAGAERAMREHLVYLLDLVAAVAAIE